MKHPRAERTPPSVRKSDLIQAALSVAQRDGYLNLTADKVVDAAGINSRGLIHYHFGGMDKLRDAVVDKAIELHVGNILVAAWVSGHKGARGRLELQYKGATLILKVRDREG